MRLHKEDPLAESQSSSSASFRNACVSAQPFGGRFRSFLGAPRGCCCCWPDEGLFRDGYAEDAVKRARRRSHQALRSQFGSARLC